MLQDDVGDCRLVVDLRVQVFQGEQALEVLEGFYALLALLRKLPDGRYQVATVELLLTLLLDLVPFHVPQLLEKLGLVHVNRI